jgi:hypothetical protein
MERDNAELIRCIYSELIVYSIPQSLISKERNCPVFLKEVIIKSLLGFIFRVSLSVPYESVLRDGEQMLYHRWGRGFRKHS